MNTYTMSSKEAKVKALLNGAQTVLPAGGSLFVNGQQVTQAQVVAKLQGMVAVYDAAATAKTQATAAVAALHAALPADDAYVVALVAGLKTLLGVTSPLLSGFGIAPPKARQAPSVSTKALAEAKRAATRKARGIMGAKQRAAIQAATTPTVVTIAAGGQPSSTGVAAPAAAATSAAKTSP